MCGIVGGVARRRNIIPVLLRGLEQLEYRGYDSCGVAIFSDGRLYRERSTRRVNELRKQVLRSQITGFIGIAHTRWATHGIPAVHNAHPHFSALGEDHPRIALVHNGIIENYDELQSELKGTGYQFESQTDTEVIAHLINHFYSGDLLSAVQKTVNRLQGAYAIAVFCCDKPYRVVSACCGLPIVIGLGQNENFLASDILALSGVTNKIIYLEDGDIADLQSECVRITNCIGNTINRKAHIIHMDTRVADLKNYCHYMQKEIFEQPSVITDTVRNINLISTSIFGEPANKVFQKIDSILVLACGTSYYAGITARYWLESIARVPVTVEVASEYRYRNSVTSSRILVVAISQSGETADTLAALKHARVQGIRHSITICNVATSSIVRECEFAYITRAGVEVSVASTKAFTTQLTALFLFTLSLAQARGYLCRSKEKEYIRELHGLPDAIRSALKLESQILSWADYFATKENVLFLGRGLHYPIALEGALKLKEVSYIHAEAYPAGELKHGPLALVTEDMPVVVIAPDDGLLEKIKSNIQEVHARGGELYVFTNVGSSITETARLNIIRMPKGYGATSPVVYTVPLQLLSYHTACARGVDVDKPRNLAKSVTVE